MLPEKLHDVGVRDWHMQVGAMSSMALCIGLWIRAKTVDQDARGNAERRALFVGFWPSMFWVMGESVHREQTRGLLRRR